MKETFGGGYNQLFYQKNLWNRAKAMKSAMTGPNFTHKSNANHCYSCLLYVVLFFLEYCLFL